MATAVSAHSMRAGLTDEEIFEQEVEMELQRLRKAIGVGGTAGPVEQRARVHVTDGPSAVGVRAAQAVSFPSSSGLPAVGSSLPAAPRAALQSLFSPANATSQVNHDASATNGVVPLGVDRTKLSPALKRAQAESYAEELRLQMEEAANRRKREREAMLSAGPGSVLPVPGLSAAGESAARGRKLTPVKAYDFGQLSSAAAAGSPPRPGYAIPTAAVSALGASPPRANGHYHSYDAVMPPAARRRDAYQAASVPAPTNAAAAASFLWPGVGASPPRPGQQQQQQPTAALSGSAAASQLPVGSASAAGNLDAETLRAAVAAGTSFSRNRARSVPPEERARAEQKAQARARYEAELAAQMEEQAARRRREKVESSEARRYAAGHHLGGGDDVSNANDAGGFRFDGSPQASAADSSDGVSIRSGRRRRVSMPARASAAAVDSAPASAYHDQPVEIVIVRGRKVARPVGAGRRSSAVDSNDAPAAAALDYYGSGRAPEGSALPNGSAAYPHASGLDGDAKQYSVNGVGDVGGDDAVIGFQRRKRAPQLQAAGPVAAPAAAALLPPQLQRRASLTSSQHHHSDVDASLDSAAAASTMAFHSYQQYTGVSAAGDFPAAKGSAGLNHPPPSVDRLPMHLPPLSAASGGIADLSPPRALGYLTSQYIPLTSSSSSASGTPPRPQWSPGELRGLSKLAAIASGTATPAPATHRQEHPPLQPSLNGSLVALQLHPAPMHQQAAYYASLLNQPMPASPYRSGAGQALLPPLGLNGGAASSATDAYSDLNAAIAALATQDGPATHRSHALSEAATSAQMTPRILESSSSFVPVTSPVTALASFAGVVGHHLPSHLSVVDHLTGAVGGGSHSFGHAVGDMHHGLDRSLVSERALMQLQPEEQDASHAAVAQQARPVQSHGKATHASSLHGTPSRASVASAGGVSGAGKPPSPVTSTSPRVLAPAVPSSSPARAAAAMLETNAIPHFSPSSSLHQRDSDSDSLQDAIVRAADSLQQKYVSAAVETHIRRKSLTGLPGGLGSSGPVDARGSHYDQLQHQEADGDVTAVSRGHYNHHPNHHPFPSQVTRFPELDMSPEEDASATVGVYYPEQSEPQQQQQGRQGQAAQPAAALSPEGYVEESVDALAASFYHHGRGPSYASYGAASSIASGASQPVALVPQQQPPMPRDSGADEYDMHNAASPDDVSGSNGDDVSSSESVTARVAAAMTHRLINEGSEGSQPSTSPSAPAQSPPSVMSLTQEAQRSQHPTVHPPLPQQATDPSTDVRPIASAGALEHASISHSDTAATASASRARMRTLSSVGGGVDISFAEIEEALLEGAAVAGADEGPSYLRSQSEAGSNAAEQHKPAAAVEANGDNEESYDGAGDAFEPDSRDNEEEQQLIPAAAPNSSEHLSPLHHDDDNGRSPTGATSGASYLGDTAHTLNDVTGMSTSTLIGGLADTMKPLPVALPPPPPAPLSSQLHTGLTGRPLSIIPEDTLNTASNTSNFTGTIIDHGEHEHDHDGDSSSASTSTAASSVSAPLNSTMRSALASYDDEAVAPGWRPASVSLPAPPADAQPAAAAAAEQPMPSTAPSNSSRSGGSGGAEEHQSRSRSPSKSGDAHTWGLPPEQVQAHKNGLLAFYSIAVPAKARPEHVDVAWSLFGPRVWSELARKYPAANAESFRPEAALAVSLSAP